MSKRSVRFGEDRSTPGQEPPNIMSQSMGDEQDSEDPDDTLQASATNHDEDDEEDEDEQSAFDPRLQHKIDQITKNLHSDENASYCDMTATDDNKTVVTGNTGFQSGSFENAPSGSQKNLSKLEEVLKR